ncbi:unnamed protein product [Mytilus coruscus]|uniref:NADAR domain-containing protein n=1 Tax=Mytilus coruscus TaxID=42192 RepID=A0A6J8D015_MYTCO|nr:unnamed protein product [Mytilus coruscus]
MITYVKGEHDVLSNFYLNQLSYEDYTYPSAEHLYQCIKCDHHQDYELLHKIKQVSDAKAAKIMSKRLKTNKSWENQKPLVMAEILKLKFIQCKDFRDKLTSTSGYINHNVPDEFWGTGRKGKGKNVFGLLLAALRLGVALEYISQPHSRKVCGRGVNVSGIPMCTIMWTRFIEASGPFIPNHFVPLLNKQPGMEPDVVNVADNSDAESVTDIRDAEPVIDVRDAEPVADISDADVSSYADLAFDINSTTRSDNLVEENLCSFIDASDSQNIHPLSNGCLQNSFLETTEVINLLSTFSEAESHDAIPQGTKNDVFFMLRNGNNITNRSNGKKSDFSDDCGVWDKNKGSTPKQFYQQTSNGLRIIFKRDEAYCLVKRVNKKRIYVPIEPQPTPETVFELSRSYAALKKDSNYKKRVSWLAQGAKESVAVVEYLGQFPGLAPHGNSKSGELYLRTPASVMTEMSDMLRKDRPLNVYNKLTNKCEVTSGPSNRKQVHDKNYNDKKKQRIQDLGHSVSRGNIADHINEIDKMLAGNKDTIVRSIIREKGKAPCLILYSDSQLEDLKHMCCSGLSIVGVDKTFNLCDMHVTVTCYKQIAVVMEKTKEPPIFMGPIYIHDNSDFDIFSNFFNHLRVKLIDADTEQLFFGTDEEAGLVKSIKTAFPESGHILCIRHLKGLVHSDDDICFDVKCEQIEDRTKELSASFHRYFATRVARTIRDLWEGTTPPGYFDKGWTNNNSESLNHVLKSAINWQSKPLLDLIVIIEEIVETQFKDLQRALVSRGQYRVADSHKHFEITATSWVNKTVQERERLTKRFKSYIPPDKRVITSTDGMMNVIKPRALGKKIGQRKRKINERTTTFKKKKD